MPLTGECHLCFCLLFLDHKRYVATLAVRRMNQEHNTHPLIEEIRIIMMDNISTIDLKKGSLELAFHFSRNNVYFLTNNEDPFIMVLKFRVLDHTAGHICCPNKYSKPLYDRFVSITFSITLGFLVTPLLSSSLLCFVDLYLSSFTRNS